MDYFQIAKLAMQVMTDKELQASLSKVMGFLGQLAPAFRTATAATTPRGPYEQGSAQWLQDSLNKLIGAGLTVDGEYGERTKAAVHKFQEANHLTADGWAGPVTVAAVISQLQSAGH